MALRPHDICKLQTLLLLMANMLLTYHLLGEVMRILNCFAMRGDISERTAMFKFGFDHGSVHLLDGSNEWSLSIFLLACRSAAFATA